MAKLQDWIRQRGATEVEYMVPDLSGVPRGKVMPAHKFIKSSASDGLRLPISVFFQTIAGGYPDSDVVGSPESPDVYLRPDPATLRPVPWYDDPTAQVICDAHYPTGEPVAVAPRHVLRRVMDLYAERGWRPVVAPEVEFYLVKINEDPDYPLEPPTGRSRRPESGRQAYGIDAVNEFDPIFEDMYDFCEAEGIEVDTLIHEAGAAQMEVNFLHGDPMALADQTFVFKRTMREAALRHEVYCTFMAKPMEDEPGSAMHIHQSVVDARTGRNLFAKKNGEDSKLFRSYIAGLQKYIPSVMPLFAPNVNSYRRLQPDMDAPINVHWARENRTVGLRVPESVAAARRVENRVPGPDANPYLAIAATLACGYIGMTAGLEPTAPIEGSAYHRAHSLPRHLWDSLAKLQGCKPLKQVLGEEFVRVLAAVKHVEYEEYHRVISSWEREFLLLNV